MATKFLLKVLVLISIVAVIRIFLLDSYRITSDSMEGELLVGDHVILNKLSYGPRVPNAFGLPFIDSHNAFFRIIGASTHTGALWNTFRIPGFSKIKRNDVIAFNIPTDEDRSIDFKTVYIKRCVGLPGDKIEIISGIAKINGNIEKFLNTYQWEFRVITKSAIDNWKSTFKLENVNIDAQNIKNASNTNFVYLVRTDRETINKLKESPVIVSISEVKPERQLKDLDIFPHDISKENNLYYVSEMILPKKGVKIKIDSTNYKYLSYLLKKFENVPVEIRGKTLYEGEKPLSYHTFRHDYFYMLGDNRSTSYDSRYWGFVPDTHLIGRVSLVFFSKENGIKWDRIFKLVI